MAALARDQVDHLLAGVEAADAIAGQAWPGRGSQRQPVQVLYVPADRVTATTIDDVAARARHLLDLHAPDGAALAAAVDLPAALGDVVHDRLVAKLATEPVEDLRIDFEDGYGIRDDATEDAAADATAQALASMLAGPTPPPFSGLRVKSFTDGLARRSVATLDRFLGALLAARDGVLPDGFAITFPKIVSVDHVAAFVNVLGALEEAHHLATGALRFEAQVETPASILDAGGTVTLRGIHRAGAGRLRGVHFGVFDYTAAMGVPPEQQRLDHPACDFARHVMQVTFAETEVTLSDGSTNVRPADDSADEVLATWRQHAAHVRHSQAYGYVQGWDLDASHLVSRYATVYAHRLDGIDDVLARLAAWEAGPDAATGSTMDEPATIRVLQRQVDRAVACGAIGAADVASAVGRGADGSPPAGSPPAGPPPAGPPSAGSTEGSGGGSSPSGVGDA